jgi:hypothetical protein
MIEISQYDLLILLQNNFGLAMFLLAVFFIIFHKIVMGTKVPGDEIVYRWMALFPLGVGGVYDFINNVYYQDVANITLNWAQSPFQYQVAIARLALGLVAILSFNASYGFRLAAVIANVTYLLGVAFMHGYFIILHGAYHMQALQGLHSWLWLDNLVLPLVMFLCMNSLSRPQQ